MFLFLLAVSFLFSLFVEIQRQLHQNEGQVCIRALIEKLVRWGQVRSGHYVPVLPTPLPKPKLLLVSLVERKLIFSSFV